MAEVSPGDVNERHDWMFDSMPMGGTVFHLDSLGDHPDDAEE